MATDTEFICEVVRVTALAPHGNADRLEVASFETRAGPSAYSTVVGRDQYKAGDLALYVGVDCLVPRSAGPTFEFLFARLDGAGKDVFRVRSARIRGRYSEGLLVPLEGLPVSRALGAEAAEALGISYHSPQVREERGPSQPVPGSKKSDATLGGRFPIYSVESLRKVPRLFAEDEIVVFTEKVHGSNFRAGWIGGRFVVGSHRVVKTDARGFWRRLWDRVLRRPAPKFGFYGEDIWLDACRAYALEQRLRSRPGIVVYGELFGVTPSGKKIQDMTYGAPVLGLRLFDAFDSRARRWLTWGELGALCEDVAVPRVPTLLCAAYSLDEAKRLAEGRSSFADELREGVVVRHPEDSRRAKWVGEGYRLRAGAA